MYFIWKKIKPNCTPKKLSKINYDIQFKSNSGSWVNTEDDIEGIIKKINNGYLTYRYKRKLLGA